MDKIQKALSIIRKWLFQKVFLRDHSPNKPLLFIMACHRSGTSILLSAFTEDSSSWTFGEFGKLNIQSGQKKLRLKSTEEIRNILKTYSSSFFVTKPLTEIPNAANLLQTYPNSRILWIYRDYKDVASSNLKQFGEKNGIKDIRPIHEEDKENWRSYGSSDRTTEIIQKYFSEDMKYLDAAALFWYSRNILFFEQGLEKSDRVMIIKYEDLVAHPGLFFSEIYRLMDKPYKEETIAKIHARSVGKGKSILLDKEIDDLCAQVYSNLEKAYNQQSFIRKHLESR